MTENGYREGRYVVDIIKISIKKSVMILMFMGVVILLGVISLSKMEMELMSSIDIPVALVMTNYPGAGPEEIESLVTDEIESAVENVEGIDSVSSTSSDGNSMVIVKFDYGVDLDDAVTDIRDKLSMISSSLPEDAKEPVVMKLDMNSEPLAQIAITSESLSDNELDFLVEDKLKPRFERLSGIASVDVAGGVKKEIVVEVNPEKMEGYGLSMQRIAQVIAAENSNQSSGTIEYGKKELSISNELKLTSIDEIKTIPIKLSSGAIVQLQDIASITEREKETDSISRVNKERCIILSITKTSDGNTVNIVKDIEKEIEKLSKEFGNTKIEVVTESGSTIENAIKGVIQNIFIGAFLAILILFVFLKNVGLTAVIGISMPLSIIGTFVLLYFSGVTLNIISLGGLSIGVGMLVDNSVVVIENIYRYRTREGYDKIKGTYRASKEVMGSLIGSTLTTIVIFVPFIFAGGLVMEIFNDLVLSIIFSLVASLIAAVTVVPMLAGNYVNNVHRNVAPKKLDFINKFLEKFDHMITKLDIFYGNVLKKVIKNKKKTLSIILAIFIASLFLTPFIGMELIPSSDEGSISIKVEAPRGSQTEVVNELSLEVEKLIENIEEAEMTSVSISDGSSAFSNGSNVSTITCKLVDKNDRKKSTAQIAEEIRTMANSISGAKITVSESSSMAGMMGSAVTAEIYGEDLVVLESIAQELKVKVSEVEGTRQVKSSLEDQNNQVYVKPDKDKIRMYGMTGSEVASQIRGTISGDVATKLKSDGSEIDIRISYPKDIYENLNQLKNSNIVTNTGAYIPLSSIAEIGIKDSPTSIARSDQERYVTVTSDVFERSSGKVNSDVQKIIDNMNIPSGYSIKLGGNNEQMTEAFSSLAMVLVLAILLVYMVMAAQFGSFINPLVIMFTIPLALTGALILLFVFREPISMMSLIGCLILVGIVVNNGIILIDFINTLRERDNMNLEEAVLHACPTRLRPILMTAMTTILGQLPLIFSTSSNSEMLRGMGLVIAGGLMTSTVLTLLVVPIMYIYFENLNDKFRKKHKIKQKLNQYQIEEECN